MARAASTDVQVLSWASLPNRSVFSLAKENLIVGTGRCWISISMIFVSVISGVVMVSFSCFGLGVAVRWMAVYAWK